MKTILDNGAALELSVEQRRTDFGIAYWQARYSFATGAGSARFHGITVGFHPSEDAAEHAALREAQAHGWGRAP